MSPKTSQENDLIEICGDQGKCFKSIPFYPCFEKKKVQNKPETMLYLKTVRIKPTFSCFCNQTGFSSFSLLLMFSKVPFVMCCNVIYIKNMSNHTRLHFFSFMFLDGWTTNDLIYQWKSQGAVQFVANLSLPGGFKMDGHANVKCDVATATGKSLVT